MTSSAFPMAERKRIALIAHDNRKPDLLDWARFNRGTLSRHHLYATGTTGLWLESEVGLEVQRFLSGPLGGDQQVGAGIRSVAQNASAPTVLSTRGMFPAYG